MAKVEKYSDGNLMAVEEISSRITNKCFPFNKAEVAQLVEQPIRNRQVGGSSPPLGSIHPSCFEELSIFNLWLVGGTLQGRCKFPS
jgi:hypothetical protein